MQVSDIVAFIFFKIPSSFSVETILKRNNVEVGWVRGIGFAEDQEEGYLGNPGEKHW